MLRTRSVRPSQIGPKLLRFFPSAQSSIKAPRIAAMPPAWRNTSRRTSMQPPAAPAVTRSRIVDPGERVKHLKEENEGRDEQPLGKTLAAQFDHQRSQNETARLRAGNEAREHVRLIDNVGIGEEQIVRLRRHGLGKLDALLLRP